MGSPTTPIEGRISADRIVIALKSILFTVLVPCTVGVWVPLLMASGSGVVRGPGRFGAIAVLILGSAVYAWCVWDFATFGRGTPAPMEAPKRLVERGLYRHTRNPMYTGVLAVILGIAALYGARDVAVYAVVVGLGFHLMVVLYEEPALRRSFGADYEAYASRVARWVPRVRSSKAPN